MTNATMRAVLIRQHGGLEGLHHAGDEDIHPKDDHHAEEHSQRGEKRAQLAPVEVAEGQKELNFHEGPFSCGCPKLRFRHPHCKESNFIDRCHTASEPCDNGQCKKDYL